MRPIPLAAALALALSAPAGGAVQDVATPRRSYVLPAPDSALQRELNRVLSRPPYGRLTRDGRLSVALVDITDPDAVRYAAHDDDRMRYAASLPKIGILLAVFDRIERGEIRYGRRLRTRLERMIRSSHNPTSSEMIRLVGFENIARTLRDPRHELYDPDRGGGIWVGRGYGGVLGLWRRDPLSDISHGATARQAARFFVMLDRGELVSPWASAEMKSILGSPRIRHKFVLGLERAHPDARVYRKSGSWRSFHADAALVERAGRKYVAVAILESPTRSSQGVLASLIVRLDALIFGG